MILAHLGCSPSGSGMPKEFDEACEQVRRLGHAARSHGSQHCVGLVWWEVAGVPIDLDAGGQSCQVEFGVELGRVNPAADPEGLDRTGRRGCQRHRMLRQHPDCLLVAAVRAERRSGHLEQRIAPAGGRELDEGAAERFTVRPVDDRTLVAAQGPDAVASAQEGEVAAAPPGRAMPVKSASTRCWVADFTLAGSLTWNGPPPRMMPDQSSRSTGASDSCSNRTRRSCGSVRPEKRSMAAYSSSAATSSALIARNRNGLTVATLVCSASRAPTISGYLWPPGPRSTVGGRSRRSLDHCYIGPAF